MTAQEEINKSLCEWFKGLTPEKKKAFWNRATNAGESHKAMNEEIEKAKKVCSFNQFPNTSPKTMTREQFEALEKSSPQEAMDYCLNGGQITG